MKCLLCSSQDSKGQTFPKEVTQLHLKQIIEKEIESVWVKTDTDTVPGRDSSGSQSRKDHDEF